MKPIYERLKKEFGETMILGFFDPTEVPADPKDKRAGDASILLSADALVKVCAFLREQNDLEFDSLMCLSAFDQTGDQPSYTLVYHLFSFKHRHKVVLKVKLPKDNANIKSVQGIWSAANWFEREAFDLIGVQFENHPDLRRLLLPPDWVGHPLRKDYEFPKEYNGISCVRPKLK